MYDTLNIEFTFFGPNYPEPLVCFSEIQTQGQVQCFHLRTVRLALVLLFGYLVLVLDEPL